MAGVDIGGGKKRELNRDVNMIPFIDLLMVTIAFLLITAVWVSYSRLETSAQMPSHSDGPVQPEPPSKDLHLIATDTEFVLTWKQAATVVSESRLPRPSFAPGTEPRYDDLADRIVEEWKRHGGHQDVSDVHVDRCVFHAENTMPFREMVAVMDAVHHAKREIAAADGTRHVLPAFQIAFASR
jgi:biopolymer transport protein ExbD